MRSISIFLIVGSLALLVACGGSGTPSGLAVTVSITPSTPQTINAGGSVNITAAVANDSTNSGVNWTLSGVGSLTQVTTTSVTYQAPPSVTSNQTVTVTATSKVSSAATATLTITVQSATAISVSLQLTAAPFNGAPAAPQTLNQGGTLAIGATVKNDVNSDGVSWSVSGGTLSGETTTAATFNAPPSVTSPQSASVTATSVADKTQTATLTITVYPSSTPAGPNVAALIVDGGLPGTSPPYANGVFTSATICAPGSTTICQTVDHLLVDTGSVGLRLEGGTGTEIAGIIPSLPAVTYSDGSAFFECVEFLDGSALWGEVQSVDIRIGNEVASGIPAQIIAGTPPSGCTGNNENTPSSLGGANGILGVGPEPVDCGQDCDPTTGGTPPSGTYFADCSSSAGCKSVFASCGSLCGDTLPIQQLTQPVFTFTTDNNGVAMTMPALSSTAPTATGSMAFGIGTETNNGLGSATIITLSSDEFTTNGLQGAPASLTESFIDSGSNGLFFPNWPNLSPACTNGSQFVCPNPAVNLSVTAISANGLTSKGVNFTVDDALDTSPNNAAFSNLAGPEQANASGPVACQSNGTGDCIFDFGFPFFYGRTVFTAINFTTAAGTPGPFFAF